jgi:hypothetical protein
MVVVVVVVQSFVRAVGFTTPPTLCPRSREGVFLFLALRAPRGCLQRSVERHCQLLARRRLCMGGAGVESGSCQSGADWRA